MSDPYCEPACPKCRKDQRELHNELARLRDQLATREQELRQSLQMLADEENAYCRQREKVEAAERRADLYREAVSKIKLLLFASDPQQALRWIEEKIQATFAADADAPESGAGRIVSKPGVMGGKPCIRGTRIPITAIQSFAEHGYSVEAINEQYPQLNREDIEAAISFQEPDPAGAGEREDEDARCWENEARRAEERGRKPDTVAVPRESLVRWRYFLSVSNDLPMTRDWLTSEIDVALGRGRS